MDPYKYTDLGSPSRKIRILVLAQALNFEAELECSLVVADLADKPKYEAISYVWGSPDQVFVPLICDRQLLKIPRNLEKALRYFRRPHAERRLWSDAICIDQRNDTEKTEQIKLMARIYSRCRHTLIWLSEPPELVAESVRTIAPESKLSQDPSHAVEGVFRTIKSLRKVHLMEALVDSIKFPLELLHAFRMMKGARDVEYSLASRRNVRGRFLARHGGRKNIELRATVELLMEHAYFRRVWTLQELCLGKSPLIVCGSSSIPMDVFWDAAQSIDDEGEHIEEARQRLSIVRLNNSWQAKATVGVIKSFIGGRQSAAFRRTYLGWALFNIVNAVCSAQVTDLRDKVIGASAIFRSMGVQFPAPDYDKSLCQSYSAATRALFRSTGALTYLIFASGVLTAPDERSPDQMNTSGLPSWSVDWRRTLQLADRVTFWISLTCFGFVGTLIPSATRQSIFEDQADGCSWEELVLNGYIQRHSAGNPVTVTAFLPPPKASNSSASSTWASWLLVIIGMFGADAREAVRDHLIYVVRFLSPFRIELGPNFETCWRLATMILKASRGSFADDAAQLAQMADFQKLDGVTDGRAETGMGGLVVILQQLNLVITSAGGIGFALARHATRHLSENPRPDKQADYEQDTTSLLGRTVALVAGLDCPVLLHTCGRPGAFRLIGTAIISGMMEGEWWPEDPAHRSKIVLV